MTYFDDVGTFHAKFGLPTSQTAKPAILDDDVRTFRIKFMMEELNEFVVASMKDDLAAAADALADLVYVALGTAHLMGLPFDEIWAEVQRVNMTKVRVSGANDPRSKRGHALDVVKGPGFVPPDHVRALAKAMRDWDYVYVQKDTGE